jgi:hypothetical protein
MCARDHRARNDRFRVSIIFIVVFVITIIIITNNNINNFARSERPPRTRRPFWAFGKILKPFSSPTVK